MINLITLDILHAEQALRVGRVNREGWMRQESVSVVDCHGRQQATVIESARQKLGGALICVGAWLRGTPEPLAATPRSSMDA